MRINGICHKLKDFKPILGQLVLTGTTEIPGLVPSLDAEIEMKGVLSYADIVWTEYELIDGVWHFEISIEVTKHD